MCPVHEEGLPNGYISMRIPKQLVKQRVLQSPMFSLSDLGWNKPPGVGWEAGEVRNGSQPTGTQSSLCPRTPWPLH